MADRPEKAYLLKLALLGSFGQVALHAGQIVFDLFPDCTRCFKKRLSQVLADPHSLVTLDRCATCMQWDLNCQSTAASKVNVPEKYPTSCHPDSPPVPPDRPMNERSILFLRQDTDFMKTTVKLAEFNVIVRIGIRAP